MKTLTVVVTGATGSQGGAVVQNLLTRGHQVRAITRNPDSARAQRMRAAGVDVRRGDFDDSPALTAAMSGADAVFAMSTPFGTSAHTEVQQGIALIDAAHAAGVGHIVYTSATNADRNTGIPHFDSKYRVEQHLAAAGVPWTVIGPAAFMDNQITDWTLDSLRSNEFAMPMPADRPLALIPAEDIAAFAVLTMLRRDEFAGRRIDIASDELMPAEIASVLGTVTGRPVGYREVPIEYARGHSDDLAAMFEYFSTVGMRVDIAALRREYPEVGWTRYADWVAKQDWASLL